MDYVSIGISGSFSTCTALHFGQSIISVDMFLNLLTTNVAEAGEVLTNIIPAIIAVFVIYVPFLIWGTVAWMKNIS